MEEKKIFYFILFYFILFYFILFERKRISCFPGEIVGGSLGCDGCGPTECFRVTHKSSEWAVPVYTHTHTLEKGGGKVKGRKNELSRISLRMMAV